MNENRRSTTSLKVISVILAILLWLFVTNENVIITRKEIGGVKLVHVNLGEGLTASYPDKVAVETIGAPKKASDINAYIDLKGLEPGIYTVPVKVGTIRGARVTSIRPEKVKVQVFKVRDNIFPVTYQVEKSPPSGYKIEGVVIVPDKCLVKGSEEVVKQVSSLVVFLDLSARTDTISFHAPVRAVDARGRILRESLTLTPEQVKVYAVVAQEKESWKVKVVPTLTGKVPEGFTLGEVRVEPSEVTLVGDKMKMKDLGEVATNPVSLDGHTSSFTEEVSVITPKEISAYPSRVRVYVEVNTIRQEAGNI